MFLNNISKGQLITLPKSHFLRKIPREPFFWDTLYIVLLYTTTGTTMVEYIYQEVATAWYGGRDVPSHTQIIAMALPEY